MNDANAILRRTLVTRNLRTEAFQISLSMLLLLISMAILPAKGQLIAVKSPAYRSDVNGDTSIRVTALGYRSPLIVKSWMQDKAYGSDVTVAAVLLNSGGEGSFVFPAGQYPHGPIAVRITGTRLSDGYIDTYYLQLYNTGGVSWNEGIPSSSPPAAVAARMSLVFADDFDAPLSISSTGVG